MIDRLLAVGGLIGTLVFGLLSIYFYRRPPRSRRLDAIWSFAVLQTRRHPKLRMYFEATEVETISRVRVLFRSSGTEAVRADDVSTTRPLTVSAPGGTILSAACLGGDAEETCSRCEVTGQDSVRYLFAYLHPGQSVVVELLVSGNTPPSVGGRVVGGELHTAEVSTIPFRSRFREVTDYVVLALIVTAFTYRWVSSPYGTPFDVIRGIMAAMSFYTLGYLFDRRRYARRLKDIAPLLEQ